MTLVPELRPGADVVSRTTPLGLRFWDAVDRRFVCDHELVVRARRHGTTTEPVRATVTTSGIYAFHDLPGMRDVENGAGDDAFWTANTPPAHSFDIDVVDLAGRFQPFTMPAQLPVKGIFAWPCADDFESPASPPPPAHQPIPLMSAPTRTLQSTCCVRAELWDATDPQASRWAPAAWAVLEVRYGSQLHARSYADALGRVLVPFPFPEIPPELSMDSPLTASGPAAPTEIPIEVSVRWQAGTGAAPPDLCGTLTRPRMRAWSDVAKSNQLTTTMIRLNEHVTLGSRDSSNRRTSRLLITA